jgi:hypothetical protein
MNSVDEVRLNYTKMFIFQISTSLEHHNDGLSRHFSCDVPTFAFLIYIRFTEVLLATETRVRYAGFF